MAGLRKWNDMTYQERLKALANNEREASHMIVDVRERNTMMVHATGYLAIIEAFNANEAKPKGRPKKEEIKE